MFCSTRKSVNITSAQIMLEVFTTAINEKSDLFCVNEPF